jgi:hypothetical protein
MSTNDLVVLAFTAVVVAAFFAVRHFLRLSPGRAAKLPEQAAGVLLATKVSDAESRRD